MYRSLLAVFVAVPVIAAPVPKDGTKESLYHPVTKGAQLVYDVMSKSGPELKTKDATDVVTRTITKVEAKDAVFRVSFTQEGMPSINKSEEHTFEVSANGIFALTGGNHEKRMPLLKLPAKEGDTWTGEKLPPLQGIPEKYAYEYKVGKEEEIEVPAGKFKTIPVEIIYDGGPSIKSWYAPKVGFVKSTSKSSSFEMTWLLKSFTEGK